MDKNMAKNILAGVGAIAVVKAAPVLALGTAIGVIISNSDKVKKAVEDVVDQVEAEMAKLEEEPDATQGEMSEDEAMDRAWEEKYGMSDDES